jgi:hypothetical protein
MRKWEWLAIRENPTVDCGIPLDQPLVGPGQMWYCEGSGWFCLSLFPMLPAPMSRLREKHSVAQCGKALQSQAHLQVAGPHG